MSRHLSPSRDEVRERVRQLRGHLGLFSFQDGEPTAESALEDGSLPELGVRAGGIVEWLVDKHGAGAVTSALQITSRSSPARGVWAVVDPAHECYVPALSGWGIDPTRCLVLTPDLSPGDVLGDRAMPAVSSSVSHLGMVRTTDSRADPSSLADGGGSGRRGGLVFSADLGATRTRMGRPTNAGHAAVWRAWGDQTCEYRGAVSPGRPRRQHPGVGDRPCRGYCASGSRSGRSSDCGSQGPSLAGRRWLFLPVEISDLRLPCAVRKPSAWAFGPVNRWLRPRPAGAESRLPSR